jgi:hypothetical protein
MWYDGEMRTAESGVYRATHLRTTMRHQGRTLAWLGRRCGRSRQHLSRIASGQRTAPALLASTISGLLGVPVDVVFERVVRAEGRGT